jgi:hypothetical protein
VGSDLVVPRPTPPPSLDEQPADEHTIDVRDAAVADQDPADASCVVCGEEAPEFGACCSSRCAGEAQRQLRRNAVRLRRLESRGAHELRHRLSERNGRLMSAILRWRPEGQEPSMS